MKNSLNLARQPIMNRKDEIVGYEFFYRDDEGKCSIDDPRHATSSVLVNLLNQIGISSGFGDSFGFINTDGPLLLTDIIRTLPKDKFIFELSSSIRHTAQVHEAIRYYHSMGYRFALDNASFHPDYIEAFGPVFPYIEFAKFDVTQTDSEQFHYFPNPYGQMTLIAYKIEFYEMLEAYEQFGFHPFQGFYFAKSHLITQSRIDPKYMDVLSLFSLLQTESSVEEIYNSFLRESALSIQLIQFLTSTHPEHIRGATSIKEMIERMGKNALSQWLLLIIYSKSGTMSMDEANQFSTFAQARVESMLKLLHLASPNPSSKLVEDARLIALLSLMEDIMNIPLENTLIDINPSGDVKDALINTSGLLGRVYAAVLKLEIADVSTAALLLKSYGVHHDQLV
jgi:EAL and modified HD-GYP domain-containing signal transduction protein